MLRQSRNMRNEQLDCTKEYYVSCSVELFRLAGWAVKAASLTHECGGEIVIDENKE